MTFIATRQVKQTILKSSFLAWNRDGPPWFTWSITGISAEWLTKAYC